MDVDVLAGAIAERLLNGGLERCGVNAYTAGREFGKKGPVFAGIRGIWSYERGGDLFFCVGYDDTEGTRKSYPTAPRIRRLHVVKGSGELLMEFVASTGDVRFVRLGRATVVPFPFKYLREFAAMHRCGNDGSSPR